jgi:uncharacterized protein YkwD
VRALFLVILAVLVAGSASAAPSDRLSWTADTRSPRPAPDDTALYRVCGDPDQGLVAVAAAVARRRVSGRAAHGEAAVRTLAVAAGVPQPWVRTWSVAGEHDEAEVTRRLESFVARAPTAGIARCGVARGELPDGEPVVAVAVVDALADLAPLARKSFAGRWVSLEATLHVAADDAKVVLLGPRGRPRRVLTSLGGGRIRSRFALDQAGTWQVQVLASLPAGPTPVVEARVFVSAAPPDELEEPAVDGAAPADPQALAKLLQRARRSEGAPRLRRDRDLDAVARAHAVAMAELGRAVHDAGDGTPASRLELADVSFRHVGENVARAPSVARLHDALWQSPSHRENMLDPSFRRVGIGLARGADGTLYGVQLFAD